MAVTLLITAFFNTALAMLLYIAEKRTHFKKMPYMAKQLICGVLFGFVAVYSSTPIGGVDTGDVIINIRDASPLCAGLIFGAPAGIIAGIIGGVFRYVAVFFGFAGIYTQIACTLSTILVGFIAAALRKYMFDDKKPMWLYSVGITIVCEIMHMLMIFFTNMNDVSSAFDVVKSCTIPMVLGNGIVVGVAVAAVSLLGKEKRQHAKNQKHISQTFQHWLLICIVTAFLTTSMFTYILQTKMSETETSAVIWTNLNDVYQDILDAVDESLLDKTNEIRSEYLDGENVKTLAEKYNVTEVNIIDTNGIIIATNNEDYIGYDMASSELSAEFLFLLEGEKQEYIQDYPGTAFNEIIQPARKYTAMTLPNGGFLQVGFDTSKFDDDIEPFVGKVAKNRHIGKIGFIIICDDKFHIVSEGSEYYGKNLEFIGNNLDLADEVEGEVFEADIEGEPHLCAYQIAEGYYILGAIPVKEAMFIKTLSIYVNGFKGIVIFATLFVLIYFLIKKIIIENIRKINIALAQIANGNLNITVEVRSNEEFASLSDDINSTVTALKRYIVEAEARIDKELEFAQQIQYSSLPVAFPDRCEFKLYAKMVTAKEVGGDFYDFYMLSNHIVAFLIADVSGKGIPSAMFMMKAKTIIKDLAESGSDPDEIFTKANEKLCENNDAGMFVTAWLGILDLSTGLLKFANAGHNPPLIGKLNGEFEYLKARSGLVLAGMEGVEYRKNELQLDPGDRIYLYTDGVTEAMDCDDKLYGEQNLRDFVNTIGEVNPEELCRSVEADVERFVGDAPQFDDITMLALTFKCILGEYEITVIPNEESRKAVDVFAQNLASKLEVLPKVANKIHIIFEEIYTNIFKYSEAKRVTISYNVEDEKLHLTFIDDGVPYNPLETEEPDVTLSAEERQIGGLGIFIVKNMTESMEYTYEDNKNILKLIIALC